jgi:hypothetical protein
MHARSALAALLALGLLTGAAAHQPGERLERFKELARQYADASEAEASDALLAALFALVDAEVIDNLTSGGPFASEAFLQERLDGFTAEWGGAAFRILQPEHAGAKPLTLALGTVTRGEPRGSLRIYGRVRGAVTRLAAVVHDGIPEFYRWPSARDGALQFVTSWSGTPTGRGSRPLYLELWRHDGREGPARIWTGDEPFPEGLSATGFAVRNGQLRVRYELHYPGWKPGCHAEAEQEDVYHQPSRGDKLVLLRRRVFHGWHRELHAAVTRLFGALAAGDRKVLGELVPDSSVRAQLPGALRADASCDHRLRDSAGTVIVAATQEREHQLAPWSLAWRRGPRGWRLVSATRVLQ